MREGGYGGGREGGGGGGDRGNLPVKQEEAISLAIYLSLSFEPR